MTSGGWSTSKSQLRLSCWLSREKEERWWSPCPFLNHLQNLLFPLAFMCIFCRPCVISTGWKKVLKCLGSLRYRYRQWCSIRSILYESSRWLILRQVRVRKLPSNNKNNWYHLMHILHICISFVMQLTDNNTAIYTCNFLYKAIKKLH